MTLLCLAVFVHQQILLILIIVCIFCCIAGTSSIVPPVASLRFEASLKAVTRPPAGYHVKLLPESGPPYVALCLGPAEQPVGSSSEVLKVRYLIPVHEKRFYTSGLSADAPLPDLWKFSYEDTQPLGCVDEWGTLFVPEGDVQRILSPQERDAQERDGDARNAEAVKVFAALYSTLYRNCICASTEYACLQNTSWRILKNVGGKASRCSP